MRRWVLSAIRRSLRRAVADRQECRAPVRFGPQGRLHSEIPAEGNARAVIAELKQSTPRSYKGCDHIRVRATLAGMRLVGLAKALIPACLVVECASAVELPNALVFQDNGPPGAAQMSIEQCVEDRAARGLDAIRGKADVSRTRADGPPPLLAALNDTFATDFERGDIAKWMGIRHRCRRQLTVSRSGAARGSALRAAALQQASALSRILQSGIDRLIGALYHRELTYGEFVRKKYEFVSEAADLGAAIEAEQDGDQSRLEQTVRRLLYVKFSWNAYLSRLHARPPGTVHNRGAIYS
jgi:hypothetical protein